MKRRINIYLAIGILLNALVISARRFFDLDDFLYGFLQGLAISLMLVGVFYTSRGALRERKIKVFRSLKAKLFSSGHSGGNK